MSHFKLHAYILLFIATMSSCRTTTPRNTSSQKEVGDFESAEPTVITIENLKGSVWTGKFQSFAGEGSEISVDLTIDRNGKGTYTAKMEGEEQTSEFTKVRLASDEEIKSITLRDGRPTDRATGINKNNQKVTFKQFVLLINSENITVMQLGVFSDQELQFFPFGSIFKTRPQ